MDIHVVQSGQTLYSIAMQYGTAPGFIARWNGLTEPYRLAVGQSLLILRVQESYTVRAGDTLWSIARQTDTAPEALLRMNPNLSGSARLYPGQVLVTRLESERGRPAELTGYAYPFADRSVLRGILPYADALAPFTYGFTAAGALVMPDDEPLTQLAAQYGVRPWLHLSTLTENGTFSAQQAALVLNDPQTQDTLAENLVRQMRLRGYAGLDVDFEYLGGALAQAYAQFLGRLRGRVNAEGWPLMAALAPKTSASQPGILYEGHDYASVGQNSDQVLVMTYEWGYTYGPPMAVAPIGSVRRVLEYALTEIPREKILMGFPNYAYDWTLPYEAGTTRARLIGNEAAPLLAAQAGAQIEYDEGSQTPYFHYTDPNGAVHEVWFEDVRSTLAKYRLMEELGLRGFGFWNFMRPFSAAFSLFDVLFSSLRT